MSESSRQQPLQKWYRKPIVIAVLVVSLVIMAVVATALFLTGDKPLTWQQRFNKEHGTALGIDIHEASQQHLLQFDFVVETVNRADSTTEEKVTQYSAIVCWAEANDSRLETDEWALFSDAVRHYDGIKLIVEDVSETADGRPLQVMKVVILPVVPLTVQAAQEGAVRVITQLRELSPCNRGTSS